MKVLPLPILLLALSVHAAEPLPTDPEARRRCAAYEAAKTAP